MAEDINLADYMSGSDWLGIGLAVVAAFVIGFVWFTFIFGKRWGREFGFDMNKQPEMKEMLPSMLKDILGNFLMAYVLWHSMMYAVPGVWADFFGGTAMADNNTPAFYGLMTAFFIWLGYFVPVALSRTGWEGRSWAWFGIDVGYNLVKLLAMGQILAAFASSI